MIEVFVILFFTISKERFKRKDGTAVNFLLILNKKTPSLRWGEHLTLDNLILPLFTVQV